jgi:ubiquinone/menaquinone biosynthesis C-methylase UbiE
MQKYGVTCTPEEFHRTINLVFHKSESRVYDAVHDDMWSSLPEQIHLLVSDYLASGLDLGTDLSVLDIGCGTGLATDLLLSTEVGNRIARINLLDTSPEMLAKAEERSAKWHRSTTSINGTIDQIVGKQKFDVIVISSVLHHIPDLPAFLNHVRAVQSSAGLLIHLQDPNGDYLNDPAIAKRIAELKAFERPRIARRISTFAGRIRRRVGRVVGGRTNDHYLERVNSELMQSGLLTKPMDPHDIWAVTDIHVYGEGISINKLRHLLPDYRLVSQRSYSFFGKMMSELPEDFKQKESELIRSKAKNGLEIAAIWKAN